MTASPHDPRIARVQRLAGMGAFGATLGLLALFALVVYLTIPRQGAGIDETHAAVTWISVGGVILALIAVHIMIGRRLLELARGVRRAP